MPENKTTVQQVKSSFDEHLSRHNRSKKKRISEHKVRSIEISQTEMQKERTK